MGILKRDEILAADDLTFEDVPVPEWGPDAMVRIRTLTGTEFDAFYTNFFGEDGSQGTGKNFRAYLLSACIVDENNNQLFSADDVDLLGKKSAITTGRLFKVAQRLNGLEKEALEKN